MYLQELTQVEYDSEKAITLQQLEEFNASLKRMIVSINSSARLRVRPVP